MLHNHKSKDYWFKKIDQIFFIRNLFLCMIFISLLFIWFYPVISVISIFIFFSLYSWCDKLGDKYIKCLSDQYPISIFEKFMDD